MTNSKQAAKRVRQSEAARQRNKQKRSTMKSALKTVAKADSPERALATAALAMKRVDKAAKSGVIHKNAAARLKSRIARQAAAAAK
jgi:small subunit ribosomal protein S20